MTHGSTIALSKQALADTIDPIDVKPETHSMTINVVDPTRIVDWDGMVRTLPGFSFFHTATWSHVMKQCYGYKPFYFAMSESHQLMATIPVMEVSSILTGKRGVSLPFTDYCEPLGDCKEDLRRLFDTALATGRERGWAYVEFRLKNGFLEGSPIAATYYGHMLDLTGGP